MTTMMMMFEAYALVCFLATAQCMDAVPSQRPFSGVLECMVFADRWAQALARVSPVPAVFVPRCRRVERAA